MKSNQNRSALRLAGVVLGGLRARGCGVPILLVCLLLLGMGAAVGALPGCTDQRQSPVTTGEGLPPRPGFAPSLIVLPEDRERILDRIQREPFATILAEIREVAEREHVDLPPDVLDTPEQRNGETALAAAFLAWLLDEEAMALKARDFMDRLSDNYDSHEDHDLNIRMPGIAMGYTFALDLLEGAGRIPPEEAAVLEEKLTAIIGAFYEEYVLDDISRVMSIQFTQNNHPIRTACSIATVAMAFPDHPDAPEWANWAFSELDYLWGPTGHYVMADGGVVEGSLYYRFAFAPSLALSLAWRNRVGEPRIFEKRCINRVDHFHWADHGCVEGEPFQFVNLIDQERFPLTSDWFLSLRMPDGYRPPIEDSGLRRDNGAGLMAGILGRADMLWDFHHDEMNMTGGMDLRIQHLAYLPEETEMPPEPPAWRHRVLPDVGHAVLRSGWGPEDIWAMLIAEHGSARFTVHDHVDGGHIQLAAYGEYLLMDTGYYKPNMMDNAVTSQASSHSLLTIAEEPVDPKGLVTNYGDADAFLRNDHLGDDLAYVEAHQTIDFSTTERAVAMVRDRYLVVLDRVVTTVAEPRHHTWRLHGYAGLDAGGSFTLDATAHRARWERDLAGVDVHLAAADVAPSTAGASELALVTSSFTALGAPHVHEIFSETAHHEVMDGLITAVAPHFAAVIAPYRVGAQAGSGDGPMQVTPLALAGGETPASLGLAGWIVSHGDYRDLVLARAEGAPESITLASGEVVETDGCWAILTLSGETAMALVARGTRLSLDGVPLVSDTGEDVLVAGP